MDNFIVSARKYRPRFFDEVIGQQAIANTLKRSIVNHKLAGAYLFCGPRGVGKTTCARIFAKAINCMHPLEDGESCCKCESCVSFDEGRSVNVQELNAAANNSVNDIRDIIDQVRIPPQLGNYKVIILDEVHMLSPSASNALLKILEEPPSYVIFILATTEKQKILPTILSRCQIFDFNRMEIGNITTELKMVAEKENISYEDSALNVIAKKADGGMRDALSIFDQVANFSGGHLTYESVLRCLNVLDYEYYFKATDLLVNHNVCQVMLLYNEIVSKGFDGGVFISGLAAHFRDLLVCQYPETKSLLDVADDVREQYVKQAQNCSPSFLYKAIRKCERCGNAYKTSYNKRLSVELTLIDVSQIDTPDEASDEGAGLGPAKILKPIFKESVKMNASGQSQTVAASSGKPVEKEPSTQPSSEKSAAVQPSAPEKKKRVEVHKPIDPELVLKQAGSISIRDIYEQDEKPEETPQPSETQPQESEETYGNELYTEAQANTVWKTFVNQLPRVNRAEQGRMQNMFLSCGDNGELLAPIDNENVVEFLQPVIDQAEAYMRKQLNNGKIHIVLKLRSAEEQKIMYDSQSLFQKLVEENKALAQLHQQFDLKVD